MPTNKIVNRGAAVVGGGLTGLTAAVLLARAGHKVVILERSGNVGGRARTENHGGFLFNRGAHALYLGRTGEKMLKELGVHYHGSEPEQNTFETVSGGKCHVMPVAAGSLLRTRMLKFRDKIEFIRLQIYLRNVNLSEIQGVSLDDWLRLHVRSEQLRDFLSAVARLTTYSNAPRLLSAGHFLSLLTARVLYLDNGWQTLVDGLVAAARELGVRFITRSAAAAVEPGDGSHTVRLADGGSVQATAVVLALDPKSASALVENGGQKDMRRWAEECVPARVSCLDVALRRLPRPHHRYALGVDRPLYYSAHSKWAKLAPEGGALIHTMKYLRPDEEPDPRAARRELESLLDLMQPGWRKEAAGQYFLPHMVASNSIVRAGTHGTGGRPGPAVPGIPNLFVAGDWVGPEGQLSDAGFASAARAAQMITTAISEREFQYVAVS